MGAGTSPITGFTICPDTCQLMVRSEEEGLCRLLWQARESLLRSCTDKLVPMLRYDLLSNRVSLNFTDEIADRLIENTVMFYRHR